MDDEGTNRNASKLQGAGGQTSATSLSNPLMRDFVSDWSPLHDASIHGRLLTLKKLIEQGSDVNLVTADQVSALHEACLGGHAACASVLLKHGAQVNGVTVDWHTPLFSACVSGSVACLNLLLQHGASLHPPCDLASPIHEAAKRGHVQCVEFLASRGVNIDHNIKHLGTPLYVACENQQVNCAKKLLESETRPAATNHSYDHSVLSQAFPWECRLPDTCANEDAEAPALLPATLSLLQL
ncbi:ankyrin repeat and SOCS box protein 9 isoform 4-T4 [Chlamydotis macqueenii]